MDWRLTSREMMIMTERDSKQPHPKAASKKTSAIVNKAVSGKLKAYYDEIAGQQVPDRLIALLDKLDEQDK
jgi:Anti-sigma factor NepR